MAWGRNRSLSLGVVRVRAFSPLKSVFRKNAQSKNNKASEYNRESPLSTFLNTRMASAATWVPRCLENERVIGIKRMAYAIWKRASDNAIQYPRASPCHK